LEVKRQPHELIDCAAGERLIQTSLVVVGSDLDVARVTGVLDATVSVPAAKPLLERPAVEGIAPFPRYNRSQNDLHGVPFVSVRTAIGLSTGLVYLVGRNMARIELLEAATQSGRRYENGDAAAQRLAAGVAVNPG
jgi:hypothetical protein